LTICAGTGAAIRASSVVASNQLFNERADIDPSRFWIYAAACVTVTAELFDMLAYPPGGSIAIGADTRHTGV